MLGLRVEAAGDWSLDRLCSQPPSSFGTWRQVDICALIHMASSPAVARNGETLQKTPIFIVSIALGGYQIVRHRGDLAVVFTPSYLKFPGIPSYSPEFHAFEELESQTHWANIGKVVLDVCQLNVYNTSVDCRRSTRIRML